MARKRQIDPIYPFEREIKALSHDARYFYILLWCHMDDTNGVVENDPEALRDQVFPGEPSIDVAGIIKELTDQKRLYMFTSNGKSYLYCPTFRKHQVINHPSNQKYPDPPKDCVPIETGTRKPRIDPPAGPPEDAVKDDCQIMDFMRGIGVNARIQTDILLAWQPGLKKRGRCYDCNECRKWFVEIVANAQAHKPKDLGLYLRRCVAKFITGD